jgi:hypothetical protein
MRGWVWSYFTFDAGVRLITEEETHRACTGGAAID